MFGSLFLGLALILIMPSKITIMISTVLIIAGLLVSIVMNIIYVRCPHCDTYLYGRYAAAICCPYCGKKCNIR